MQKAANRIRLAVVCALCLFFSIAWSAEQLPVRLSDEAFWKLITDFSEPGGTFISDNFLSNELAFQDVLTNLTDGRKGDAYLGVGPEQNFTYIAALKPKIAFVFDIRRQNMIEHLTYKALFEISTDRAAFLSRLFSRPRPADLGKDSSAVVLMNAFREIAPDQELYEGTVRAIKNRLINEHGFSLTTDDENSIANILRAFYVGGPDLTYSGPRAPNVRTILPTYEELMTDSDSNGKPRSFVATEDNFLAVQQLEKDNLIIPLVGDFAGPSAIQSVGQYLKEHNATVTAFYVSNVEQYLFMSESWKKFYANVATLPLDSKSVFIRPLINVGTGAYTASPLFRSGFHWDTLLFSMQDLLAAFSADMIHSYYDVIQVPN